MLKPLVYLIGAGPGDPGLLTIRGKWALETADTVVYDRLAGERILSYANPEAELLYVGKSPQRHTLRQEEINALLVEKALEGRRVARLKGGDPFVFGRGGEEAEYLRQRGVPYEVVPGISSAIAAPAYAGIPLTHRDYTTAVGIFTGHEDPHKGMSDIPWAAAAQLKTAVFLMGMENLEGIVGELLRAGRSPGTPVALVRWGTRPEQETMTGTLSTIAAAAVQRGFSSPAVIVVGEVVNLRRELAWFEMRPLFGCRVVVTRSRTQASALSRQIEELGGEAYEFPCLRITPPADPEPLRRAVREAGSYQWLVFTSQNGVEAFFRVLREGKSDVRRLAGVRLAAIGPATAAALRERGLEPDLVPEEYRAERVAEGLLPLLAPGDRVLLPRAAEAREVLPQQLREAGIRVNVVEAYRSVPDARPGGMLDDLRHKLADGRIGALTFASSSTVRNFVAVVGKETGGALTVCIGPITAATAREAGLTVDAVAEEYTIDGLCRTLVSLWQRKKDGQHNK